MLIGRTNRRTFIAALGGAAAWPLVARAQRAGVPVIGFLSSGRSDDFNDVVATFRKGLTESGFVEGQNVVIEYRWADGQYDRLPALVADLVHRPVTLIFTNGGLLPARAAKAATETIPIVFEVGTDPVRLGLVASLNRPGGNVTGVTLFSGVVLTKRLGLLRELAPNSTTIAMFVNSNNPNAEVDTKDIQAAARDLGLQLHVFHAVRDGDVDTAFASLIKHNASALLVGADPFIDTQRHRIVALAAQHAVPAIYAWREFVHAGGLISYGARLADGYREAASYTGRILRGAKPGDLPILQPTHFELVINLRTAKTLGLDVPTSLLARADEVIE
jgi:putative ABC transport system substrate-binding protein